MARALLVVTMAFASLVGSPGVAQAAMPALAGSPVSVAEDVGSGTAVVTLQLDRGATQPTAVDWKTAAGSASAADFVADSGTVVFAAGKRVKTVTVALRNDSLDEATERFHVVISSDDASIATPKVPVSIVDDDPLPLLSAGKMTSVEGARGATKTLAFPVTLASRSGRDVRFAWNVVSGSAVAGVDVKGEGAHVRIPAGQRQVTVPVVVVGDNVAEGTEAAKVKLSSLTSAALKSNGTVTITDDDDPAESTDLQVQLATGRAGTRAFKAVDTDERTLLGGVLKATGSDGTTYTLTIPKGALLAPTTITMTPWRDVEGVSAEGGPLVGVDLKPNGLELVRPARLVIDPPGANPLDTESFAYLANGRQSHRYPLNLDASNVVFDVFHFSGYGTYVGDNITVPVVPPNPANPEQALNQALQQLTNEQRARDQQGQPPSEEWANQLQALMQSFYDVHVQPKLQGIRTDCAKAKQHNGFVLRWARRAALLFNGGEGFMAAEQRTVIRAVAAGVENCLNKAMQPCVDKNNATQMREIMTFWRMLGVVGGTEPDPPPLHPSRECGVMSGTIVVRHQKVRDVNGFRTEEDYTVTLTPFLKHNGAGGWHDNGHGTWSLTGGATQWDNRPDVKCTTNYEYVYSGNGMFYAGSHPDQLSPDTDQGLGKIELYPFVPTYSLPNPPEMSVEVVGNNNYTSYFSTASGCDSTTQDRGKWVAVPGCEIPSIDLVGTVVEDPSKGMGVKFDCHHVRDDSTEGDTNTQEVTITGTVWQNPNG